MQKKSFVSRRPSSPILKSKQVDLSSKEMSTKYASSAEKTDFKQKVYNSKDEASFDEKGPFVGGAAKRAVDHPFEESPNEASGESTFAKDAKNIEKGVKALAIDSSGNEPEAAALISISNSDRERPSSCVFVASLTAALTDDELSHTVTGAFSKYGDLRGVKVLRDTYNRPYAFVQYDNDKDAKTAILMAHNTELAGRVIRCEHAKVNRTLFLSSSISYSKTTIQGMLEVYGEIEKLFASEETGEVQNEDSDCKYWYIQFAFREDAIRAFVDLKTDQKQSVEWCQNIEEYDGFAHKNSANEDGDSFPLFDKNSIFIGQLSKDVDKDSLLERFKIHGEISNIFLTQKPNSNFAFVTYIDEVSAARAVEKENHSMFMDRTMHVQYKEYHTWKQSSRYNSMKKGVQLAPPPIHVNRRIQGDEEFNSKNYRVWQKGNPVKYNSKGSFYSSSSFNGYGNNYNSNYSYSGGKRFAKWAKPEGNYQSSNSNNRSAFSQQQYQQQKNFAPRTFYPSSNIQRKFNLQRGSNPTTPPISNKTPPPSVTSNFSNSKSISPSSSAVKSDKSSGDKEDTTNTSIGHGSGLQQQKQPYFYYIPTSEMAANAANVHSPVYGYGGYQSYSPLEAQQQPFPYYQYYYPPVYPSMGKNGPN